MGIPRCSFFRIFFSVSSAHDFGIMLIKIIFVYQYKMRAAAQPAIAGAVSLDAMDEIFEFEEEDENDES